MQFRYLITLFFVTLLAACGGGQANTDVSAGAATRIEIAPNAVLLTTAGQKKTLAVKVFDAAGNAAQAPVEWTSSHPENIAIDASGTVTATSNGGSSLIIARIGTVQSPPLLAVHTQIPAGAVLLTDANIIGEPEESTPDATPSFSNTYRVRLTGVAAPQIGALLISTESKAVAGRVLDVQSNAGEHVVTLIQASLRETFPHLAINEVIDLSQAEVIIPDAVSTQFDIVRSGNNFTFTPRIAGAELPLVLDTTAQVSGVSSKQMASAVTTAQVSGVSSKQMATAIAKKASGTFATGPVGECKLALDGASGAGSLPISVLPTLPFSVDIKPKLQIVMTSENGLERLVLHTEPTVSAGLEFKVLVAFEGKVTCDLELFIFRLPVGGPLALFVGGLVPVGIGAELGGKFTFADMALGARLSAKTTVDTGIACPPGLSCTMVAETGPLTTTVTPTLNGPGLADFRFEPSLTVYGFAKASFGSAIFSSLRFDALAVKAGPALKGNFAPRLVQMADAAYKSDYQLAGVIKAGADTQFEGFLNLLGLAGIAETALLDQSFPLATSPTGTVSADVASFVTGDTVNFKVVLDPTNREFLSINNVSQVVLVRNDIDQTEVARTNVAAGQTEITLPFTAPNAGSSSEFFAFVVTALVPDLLELELGQATGPSEPTGMRGSVSLSSQTTTKQFRDGSTSERVVTVTVAAPVMHDAAHGLVLLSPGFSGSVVFESNSVSAIDRSPCFFDAVTDVIERTSILPRGPETGSITFTLTGDNWVLDRPELPVTTQKTTTTRRSTANVRGDCTGFDLASTTETVVSEARSASFDPDLSLTRRPPFQGSLSRDAKGLRSLVFSDSLTELVPFADAGNSQSVTTSVQLTLTDQPSP